MRWLRIGLGVALAGATALGLGFLWFLSAAQAEADPLAAARRTDAIVVLTGGQDRVETALGLLEQGVAPRLLVSGAAARLTLGELARAHGRDPARLAGRVTLGKAAATTAGNAAETAAWAAALAEGGTPIGSIRVVTAGYHMPRALLELGRALPGVELLAHPVAPSGLRSGEVPPSRAAFLLAGEYVKFGVALAGLAALMPARESARR
jgi:uncharacterized SAM-binding protein YcdF (DUF218 family)